MFRFSVQVEGLEALVDIGELSQKSEMSLVQAINKIAGSQRTVAAREISKQVNIPKAKLQPGAGRLTVSRKATRSSLEARITARGRPTSLATFAKSKSIGRAGVALSVKPGQSRYMKRAFLIKLKRGTQLTETEFNLGLAIRLRPGERLSNKVQQVKFGTGLYLLYGPSIQQIFLDNQKEGVAADISEPTLVKLEEEYRRLMALK